MLYHSNPPSSSLLDAISSVKPYGLASTSGFFTHAVLTPPISLLSSPHLHLLCLNRRPIPAVATVPRCCYSSGMTHLLHLQVLPLHILILTFPPPQLKFNVLPGNPISNVYMSQDNRFAFIEFRSADECTAALKLNG